MSTLFVGQNRYLIKYTAYNAYKEPKEKKERRVPGSLQFRKKCNTGLGGVIRTQMMPVQNLPY